MPSTGKQYLRIDRAVDERYDPWKSSEAAAKLLRANYKVTGAWPLAVTAYNHGAGGMMKAAKQLGTKDISVIIDRYQSPSFGFASRNFYTEFLAAHDVETAAGRHFGALSRMKPAQHEMVVMRQPTSATALARTFGIDVGLLRELNLGLRDSVWKGSLAVPAGYAVRLPKVAGRAPAEKLLAAVPRSSAASAASSSEGTSTTRYRVKRGDTLGRIAQRNGMTTTELAKLNGLRSSSHLRVGQTLRLPGGAVAKTSNAKPAKTAAPKKKAATKTAARSHTVKKGETLSAIARRSGVSVKQLATANGISSTHRVRTGERLRIPD
jgi:membrane-bound lytic murein transglycosylase D